MAEGIDWRISLTASERYDNIQKLTTAAAAAGLNQSAYSIENGAYKTASSREEYDAACDLPTAAAEPGRSLSPGDPTAPETDGQDSSPGIPIGSYQDCRYIASGVTAEVYRAQTRALKVIVETHNIEPHNPHLEVKILNSLRSTNAPNIITLLETFRDRDQRLVLVFPYMPFTLSHLLDNTPNQPLPTPLIRTIFTALFRALHHLHSTGIIHRDIKPSAILLPSKSPTPSQTPQIHLSDFGTAWHPTLSPAAANNESPTHKVLDIGTGPYRAPETLFGDRAYGPAVDLWAAGATLAECFLGGRPLFESRAAHEDGNQLGLVLSIFQTLGTPTKETWPEAVGFRTPPFEMYRVFEGREGGWAGILPGLGSSSGGGEEGWRELVAGLVRYESGERVKAGKVLELPCMKGEIGGGDEA
ncbi:kinase-like domain-containing protein [Chaetomidium leptoderma]|uniref:cyclin-dependent kinase n=1 Tax=Chaetomidium leptoderma TaxID=669021 RepID=A0AAN6ZSR5_9PEZI|nr:kinase-like domain-containing protein [Chaetomidium leptoderma]